MKRIRQIASRSSPATRMLPRNGDASTNRTRATDLRLTPNIQHRFYASLDEVASTPFRRRPTANPLKATSKRLQSVHKATPRLPQGFHRATNGRAAGVPKATLRIPQGYPKATHKRGSPSCGERTPRVFHVIVQFELRLGVMEGWVGGLAEAVDEEEQHQEHADDQPCNGGPLILVEQQADEAQEKSQRCPGD